MSQFSLSQDQYLHGKDNYANWSLLVTTAAKQAGLKEYLENDILGTISRPDFVINLGLDDVANSVIMTIVMDSMAINPNGPLSRVYNTLLNPAAAAGALPALPPEQQGENAAEAQNNAPAAQAPQQDLNLQAANRLINLPLFKSEVIRLAKQKNAQASLLMVKNVDSSILTEMSRYTNPHHIYTKLKEKYGNGSTDTEFWLRKLRTLKAKDNTKIIKTMESVIDIYQEMDELRINLSQAEKLKYMYQTLPEDFRERLGVTLRFTYQQLYEKAKEELDAKSYLEDWNEKDKDDIDDPMDIDFLSRESGYRRKRSHSKNKKHNPYFLHLLQYGLCFLFLL